MESKSTPSRQHKRILDVHRRLLQSAQKGSVLAILQCAYEVFSSPIVLTNKHYRLIAQWPQEHIGDTVYDSLLLSPVLPIDIVQDYTSEYLQGKEPNFAPFYVDTGVAGTHPRILAEIIDKSVEEKRTLGHFGILLGHKPLQNWHLEAAEILAETLAILLNRHMGLVAYEANSASHELFDLLDPAVKKNDFDNIALVFQRDFPLPWQILYADVGTSTDLKTLSPLVVSDIVQRFPSLAILHDRNELILLAGSKDNKRDTVDMELRKAALVLQDYAYQSILLPKVYVPEKMRNMRDLAKIAAAYLKNTKQKAAKLFDYEDLAASPLYFVLAKHPAIHGMCHPLLDQLKIYDSVNASEYYLTLESFCACNFKMAVTAERLHIHRNTLIYRLNRLQETFSIDLSDDELLQLLSISFKVQSLI